MDGQWPSPCPKLPDILRFQLNLNAFLFFFNTCIWFTLRLVGTSGYVKCHLRSFFLPHFEMHESYEYVGWLNPQFGFRLQLVKPIGNSNWYCSRSNHYPWWLTSSEYWYHRTMMINSTLTRILSDKSMMSSPDMMKAWWILVRGPQRMNIFFFQGWHEIQCFFTCQSPHLSVPATAGSTSPVLGQWRYSTSAPPPLQRHAARAGLPAEVRGTTWWQHFLHEDR